jgi:hypothetical protein
MGKQSRAIVATSAKNELGIGDWGLGATGIGDWALVISFSPLSPLPLCPSAPRPRVSLVLPIPKDYYLLQRLLFSGYILWFGTRSGYES